MPLQPIIQANQLAEGQTVKFSFCSDGVKREGFLARHQGRLVAYDNVCRHIPMPIDDMAGRFFNTEGDHFICQTHGALYEPLSGLCVRGPCEGAYLKRLEIEVVEGTVCLLTEEPV